MARGIKKIRARIKQRKKLPSKKSTTRQINHKQGPLLFADEDKHGIQIPFHDVSESQPIMSKHATRRNRSFYQVYLSVLLFIICAIILKTSFIPSQSALEMTEVALTEEFPFAAVHKWYEATLGTPLALTPERASDVSASETVDTFPIEGEVMETFSANGTGIMIGSDIKTDVKAWREGIVIFSGNHSATGQTVIVQHPDGSKTTYGLLSDIDTYLYKVVQKDDVLGTFNPSKDNEMAYFAIEKNRQFIDPAQVIPVDDFQ